MAGRTSSISVFLKLHGQRQFAKEVEASGAALEAMGLKGAKAISRFAAKADSLKKFGKSWTRNVTLPMLAFGVVAGKMSLDFNSSMLKVSTQAGASQKEVKKMSAAILNLSSKGRFAQGPLELSEALFDIESVGFRGARAMKTLKASSDLATVGGVDLESTTSALVGTMKTGIKGAGNMKNAIGTLNATIGAGKMHMEDLNGAVGTGFLGSAKGFGLSLPGVGAALAELTSQGVPAESAATRLRMAFSLMGAPTEKAQKALKGIGIGSEDLAKKMRSSGGVVTALELLQSHTRDLSETEQTALLAGAFGGAKSGGTILQLLGSLGDLSKKQREVIKNSGDINAAIHKTNKDPLVKLQKEWSGIQSSLIGIGESLLPTATSVLQKFAGWAIKVSKAFVGLPSSVKEVGLGFLLLTGPIASGLGYFAGGLGKALVLTKKLAVATSVFGSILSPKVMTERSGLGGAFGAASGKIGLTGALRAAKGFAVGLGPAVAAAGIANIVISATNHDWREAGFEAGGAAVGGIAAVMTGNPELAPLAAGLGSFAGKLLYGLFSSGPRISPMRRELEHLSRSTQNYKKILHTLPASQKAARSAAQHHAQAIRGEKGAEHNLTQQISRFGTGSLQAAEAQLELNRAQHKVTNSARGEKNAHRLAGAELKLFRMRSLEHVASIKQLLPLEKKRAHALAKQVAREPHNTKLVAEQVHVLRLLKSQHSELIKSYAAAEEKGGKPWAHRLESLNDLQAKYGFKGKILTTRINEQKTRMHELNEVGGAGVGMWKNLNREIGETVSLLKRFQEVTGGTASFKPPHVPLHHPHRHPHRHPLGEHGPINPSHSGHHLPKRRNLSSFSSFAPPAPQRARLKSGSLGEAIMAGGGDINVNLNVDGEVLARVVARKAHKAANRA